MAQREALEPEQIQHGKLTLHSIGKTLSRWMNKQDKRDIEEQSHFQITEALELVFEELNSFFRRSGREGPGFQEVMRIYVGLFQCTGNNKHRYLVQNHLKELLKESNYGMYKLNKLYYEYFIHVFDYFPYLVFRLLQSRYKEIFLLEMEEVIKLYAMYIKFATTRKNDKLIQQYIQLEVSSEKESLQKLQILLLSYCSAHAKPIQENSLKQIIKIVTDYNSENTSRSGLYWQSREGKMQKFCETLFKIKWPQSLKQFKSRIALGVIQKWQSYQVTFRQKKSINAIINSIQIDQHIQPQLQKAIKEKINDHSIEPGSFALNCQFVMILLRKFTREISEKILTKEEYIQMIDQVIRSDYNREEKIQLVEVLRCKNIYSLQKEIEERLFQLIKIRFPTNQKHNSLQMDLKDGSRKVENLIFALKTIRFYNFEHFDSIYTTFKKYILRNSKLIKQSNFELKKQILHVCLHYVKTNKFMGAEDERAAFKDIIELIKHQSELKIMMIEYIVEHLNDRFYSQSQIYTIYSENKYDYLLYEDFSTSDIVIKIFSIKTICYLAEDANNEHRFFLKNAYNVIYDRLAIPNLLSAQEMKTGLQVIREIIRHRGEMFESQADKLAELLIKQLHKFIQFHSPQVTSITGYIMKIFQALLKKLPVKMVRYVPYLAHYAICIINFKIIKKELKKLAIETFCEIVQNCYYVLLPYFSFSNLYNIIREMMRSDDHFYFYQVQIMRLIGKLGYINKEEYLGLRLLINKKNEVENNFQSIFKETWFIHQYRQIIKSGNVFSYKPTMMEDGFYTQQDDLQKSSIEIEKHTEYIIVTVANNISLSIQEVKLAKSLKTLHSLIPVITKSKDQQLLHSLLLPRLFQVEQKYSNEVLNLILEMLKQHEIGTRCIEILKFYLKKIYNHRREDDLIWLFCQITEKYSQLVESELINIVIVVKKIILDNLESGSLQHQKIRGCFKIIMNLGAKIDRVLHLFFSDINKMLSPTVDKYEHHRNINMQKEDISKIILSDYLTFLLFLTQKCSSSSYFLPSIRIFVTTYFNREISCLRQKQKSKKRQHFKSQQQKKFLYKLIDTMIYLMIKYGKRCESFICILQTNIKANNINHLLYNKSEQYFKKHSNLDYLHCAFNKNDLNRLLSNELPIKRSEQVSSKIMHGDEKKKIIKQFEVFCLQQNNTEQQEELWLDNLALQLFNSANEPILQACSQLAAYDKLFAFDMLEVPFYFFWKSLYNQAQQPQYTYDFSLQNKPMQVRKLYIETQQVIMLTNKIKTVLLRKQVSLRIRQKLLDCIYFIQRCEIPFLIKDKVLSDAAVLVQDQAKALFYLQREYQNDPQVYGELLIDKYAEIGQKQSAIGLFKNIKEKGRVSKQSIIKLSQKLEPTVQILEDLNLLRDKSKVQQGSLKKDNVQKFNLLELQLKRDICDWESIAKFIQKQTTKSTITKSKLAHFAIEAAINMSQWDTAKNWQEHLDKDNINEEVKIWLAMLSINQKKYQQAEKYIGEIRDDMNYKIRQMFNLSYEKSMKGVLLLQQVAELEEIINYNRQFQLKSSQNKYRSVDEFVKRLHLENLWNDRLEGAKTNLYSMQKILTVRSLLFSKSEDLKNWIKFCLLAIKQNQKYLATFTYNQLKKLDIKDQIKQLQLFVIAQEIQILQMVTTNEEAFNNIHQRIVQKKMLEQKKCLGLIFQIYSGFAQRVIEEEKFSLEKGNKLLKTLKNFPSFALKDYYQLSHFMGLINIKLLEITGQEDKKKTKHQRKLTITVIKEQQQNFKNKNELLQDKSFTDKGQQYMLSALRCFIKSVTFNQRENKFFLEDCLKILNLISMGNHSIKLIDQLRSNYNNIPRQGLIEIIPQLIARLDNQVAPYKDLMKDMLIYIGKQHPQSLLFPLLYMKRGYKSETKRALAIEIIEKMSQKSVGQQRPIKSLFNEAEQIVQQLCKISLKLSEKVFLFMRKIIKSIEQNKTNKISLASIIIQFCCNILQQHENISSPSQFGFIQEYRESITVLIQHLVFYKQFSEPFYFNEAVRIIKEIKNKISQTLSSIKKIYLEQASNKLFNIKRSQVILFGTFNPQGRNVTIDSFKNEIQIILSKQRPKKLVIIGSDEKEYKYLLKGKQDLRLDQRIMQLFSFINKMFHSPSDKQSYSIQGYSITNISKEIGIISWVEKCDTMGELIQNYRYSNGVRVDNGKIQSKLCRFICPTYPHVEKYHKVEIYHEVINEVSGMDLKNIFCKRAQTSEKWLKNRSCFIRSLAVMSVVGYLIGLGDRHPFNIMIQRDTAKIVHIDFGDCFEVNKMRKVFPEKVPFRLTRMLVNAMDACKTDGIFKHTCEKIMKILRMNKQSILVIVEAFKYDPLFGWKLITNGEKDEDVRLLHDQEQEIGGLISQNDQEQRLAKLYTQKQEQESTKHILNIIKNKLIGKDNDKSQKGVSQSTQVDNLIKEAMSPLNLVQHFQNWCIFW